MPLQDVGGNTLLASPHEAYADSTGNTYGTIDNNDYVGTGGSDYILIDDDDDCTDCCGPPCEDQCLEPQDRVACPGDQYGILSDCHCWPADFSPEECRKDIRASVVLQLPALPFTYTFFGVTKTCNPPPYPSVDGLYDVVCEAATVITECELACTLDYSAEGLPNILMYQGTNLSLSHTLAGTGYGLSISATTWRMIVEEGSLPVRNCSNILFPFQRCSLLAIYRQPLEYTKQWEFKPGPNCPDECNNIIDRIRCLYPGNINKTSELIDCTPGGTIVNNSTVTAL